MSHMFYVFFESREPAYALYPYACEIAAKHTVNNFEFAWIIREHGHGRPTLYFQGAAYTVDSSAWGPTFDPKEVWGRMRIPEWLKEQWADYTLETLWGLGYDANSLDEQPPSTTRLEYLNAWYEGFLHRLAETREDWWPHGIFDHESIVPKAWGPQPDSPEDLALQEYLYGSYVRPDDLPDDIPF